MTIAKNCCPDCGCNLDARWHNAVHEMWEVGQANAEEYRRERLAEMSITVEIIHDGKRYRGAIPCVGEV